jgi:hypothetical protein
MSAESNTQGSLPTLLQTSVEQEIGEIAASDEQHATSRDEQQS